MHHLRVLGVARSRFAVVKTQPALTTREAYDRWAPRYPPEAHNPLMRAEQAAMLARWPHAQGKRMLDLACGSGRYTRRLLDDGAALVVATDFSAAMLGRVSGAPRVCADMMNLPFKDASFDGIVSGLAVGHAANIRDWVHECARVLRGGGTLLYSDFHAAAADAGLTRDFIDANGARVILSHARHAVEDQIEAITAAGLTLQAVDQLRVGIEFREPLSDGGEFQRRWHGLPLLLILLASKP
jgi:malonyl-CoA O-methyltransferase